MLNHNEQVGKLDRRITFQKKVISENVSNEDEEAGWGDLDITPVVWASKKDNSGNESYAADRLNTFQGVVFVIRFRSDINTKMRVVFAGVAYNIVSLSEIGRKRYLSVSTSSGYQYSETTEEGEGVFDDTFDTTYN